jgi:catechol 2,3-dioxygenase-like lactoylglutathione lyase family enzyme
MAMEPRISIVTLVVRDVQASYDAHSNILGFPSVKGIEDDIGFLSSDHILLAVCPKDKPAEDACTSDDDSGFTLVHNVKSKREVDEIVRNLKVAGVKITKEHQNTFWGGYDAYFQDPDGYSWELTWIPLSWLESHTQ